MTDEVIKTKSVGKDFVKSNPILLDQTATTALVFYPAIHPGGVRGELLRLRKNKNDDWEKIPEVDFRKLELHEGTHIEFSTDALRKLVEEVLKRQEIATEGVKPGRKEYIIADKDKVVTIDDTNKREVIEQLFAKGYSEEFWYLVKSSHPELAAKLTAGHLQLQRKAVVDTLKRRLGTRYAETSGADSWQNWIYEHNWLFGPNYELPIEKAKINLSGIMPDFLFPTIDGFVDILEIKLPDVEVVDADPSHSGSWIWSRAANSAIGQVVNYLNEIDRMRLEIERKIESKYRRGISLLKPRAFILIGQSDTWGLDKKEGLRKLNHALHGIEVVTYSDLLHRGMSFVNSPGENP